MKKKGTKYPTSDQAQKVLVFRDMAAASQYGTLKADRRVQVTMPSAVVDELDRLFSDQDRNHLLTKLALEAIIKELIFADRPELTELSKMGDIALDEMGTYLFDKPSILLCWYISTHDTERVMQKIGELTPSQLKKVRQMVQKLC